MSNWTQEQIDFATMCDEYDWPEELMEAWLYCHSVHETPFPRAYWSLETVREVAEGVERLYHIACQKHALEQQQVQTTKHRKESLVDAASHAVVGIGLTALSVFLRGRR